MKLKPSYKLKSPKPVAQQAPPYKPLLSVMVQKTTTLLLVKQQIPPTINLIKSPLQVKMASASAMTKPQVKSKLALTKAKG